MKKTIKVSVAIATFNEKENIAACLTSVKFADEVVVVDGSSGDNTRELALAAGAKVIKTTNPPIFHLNKNKAIKACQGDWILVLDADERVSPALAAEMQAIASQKFQPSSPAGYWLNRSNLFLGRFLKKGGQYPDPVIRFFRRGHGWHPAESVHEQIKIDGEIGRLKNDLLHLASPTFTRYLVHQNRYSSLEAEKMIKNGFHPGFGLACRYFFWLPFKTFFLIFFRHKGFYDGFPGFVFALFSGFHFILSYIKFWERKNSPVPITTEQDWT